MVAWSFVVLGCGRENEARLSSPSGSGTPVPNQTDEKPIPPSTRAGEPEEIGEFVLLSINQLVNVSHAAIRGTVLSVTEPRWNSKDGQPWTGDQGPTQPRITPNRYRDAEVSVSSVLYSSERLQVKEGDVITVRLYGDGTSTGTRYEGGGYPGMRGNSVSGPIEPSSEILWILSQERFVSEDAPEVIRIVNHFQGNWTIRHDKAESAEPRRTVEADALIERLKGERARGFEPPSRDGVYNPLGK